MLSNHNVIESAGGYTIANSLRLRSSATAYLSRTFGTPTNANIWTYSQWVKRGTLGVRGCTFGGGGANAGGFEFVGSTDVLDCNSYAGSGSYNWQLVTNRVFRDPSAHYHIMVVYDSTQATAANRVKLYINGVQEASFSTATYPTQNTAGNVGGIAALHRIGFRTDGFYAFDGYLSDVYFIDGQALTPTSFGEFNSDGVWVPKAYTGTYGTNGFYLKFNDGSNLTNLCLDSSGNGNNWTSSGVSLTADWMLDTPTNNYSTWNPLNNNASTGAPTDGNLKGFGDSGASYWRGPQSTLPVDASGNWWAEFTLSFGGSSGAVIGITPPKEITGVNADMPLATGAKSYRDTGVKVDTASTIVGTAYGASYTTGDVIGVHLNAGVLTFYKQTGGTGSFVSQGTAWSGLSGLYCFFGAMYGSSANYWAANFGQRPSSNSASVPSGAKSICTANRGTGSITTSGTFTGNANADGPFVWLNGNPESLTINGNAVTWGTHADKLAGGFKVRTASSSYNASGSNTYTVTVTGKLFGDIAHAPNTAKGNP